MQLVHMVEVKLDTYCQLSPSMITPYVEQKEFKPLDFLSQCLTYMRGADVVVFRKDWRSSQETLLLHTIAVMYKLEVMILDTLEDGQETVGTHSPVRKAYEAGQMPIDHQKLLAALKHELGEGVTEGEIQLEKVLQATGYMRASALKMLRHMQNFGVLETEPRYRCTWVKLIKGCDDA